MRGRHGCLPYGRAPFLAECNKVEAVAGEASLALARARALEEREKIGVDAVEPYGCTFWFMLPLHHMENGDIDHAG